MSIYNPEKKFYVYQYLRGNISQNGSVGTPYYVGKGCGRRYNEKYNRATFVPTNPSNIIKIAENLTEVDALQLEMLLIHQYGRIDNGTGILRNLTDGGDGVRGERSKINRKRLDTLQNRYGTMNVNTKNSVTKCRRTKIARYGTINSIDAIEKRKVTLLERYGTTSTMSSQSAKKIGDALRGKLKSEQHKLAMKGPIRKELCPICNKLIGANALTRHINFCLITKNLMQDSIQVSTP